MCQRRDRRCQKSADGGKIRQIGIGLWGSRGQKVRQKGAKMGTEDGTERGQKVGQKGDRRWDRKGTEGGTEVVSKLRYSIAKVSKDVLYNLHIQHFTSS